MRWLVLLSALLPGLATPVSADTYVIHPDGTGDFPTIQAAVDFATDEDRIELTDGVFRGPGNRDIDLSGKSITITSQSGNPLSCIIDCQGLPADPHRGFLFTSNENGMLLAITITNGYADRGAAIFCVGEATTPYLARLVVFGNEASECGGGVYCEGCPLFEHCIISENVAPSGGGASVAWCVYFHSCLVAGNLADTGGGIHCTHSAHLVNCTLVHNAAAISGGGIFGSHNFDIDVGNTIVAFNEGGAGVTCEGYGSIRLACSDVYGNVGGDWVDCIAGQYGIEGNISEDPLFCDPDDGDFTLDECSPCTPFSPPNPECDLIGALPVGCGGGSPAIESTWGAVKALFRD